MNDKNVISGLNFHHVGLLVHNMGSAIEHYSQLFGKNSISNIITVSSQKVQVCFVQISDANYIELVEPLGEESPVCNLLKKSVSYYHMAYKVNDIHAMARRLEQLNYKVLDYFNSEAFASKPCMFVFTPDAHLIELIEQ
ncbi:MAG: VOC family protein [Bacteroidota bacterium]